MVDAEDRLLDRLVREALADVAGASVDGDDGVGGVALVGASMLGDEGVRVLDSRALDERLVLRGEAEDQDRRERKDDEQVMAEATSEGLSDGPHATSVIQMSYTCKMTTETCKTRPTLRAVSPKQTRPRMVVVNFRVPAEVKEAALERAEREGINLTDALRDFLSEWAKG